MLREVVRGRAAALTLLVVIPLFALLVFRLAYLQVFDARALLERANLRGNPYRAHPRGLITDSDGTALALSLQVWSLAANPRRLQDKPAVARTLAPLLGLTEEKLLTEMDRDLGFVWLKRRLDEPTADAVRALKINHLTLVPEYVRVYPYGPSAAHVLGFVGMEDRGLEGIERDEDAALRYDEETGRPGNTVVLTLNRMIQHITEDELGASCDKFKAAGGTAVVLDIKTGAVLAMASYPVFDPNRYDESDSNAWRNRCLTDVFEPGSIFKIFVGSALLERNLIPLTRTSDCHVTIARYGHVYNCHEAHGVLDFPGVIAHSCNVGMIEAVEMIKADELYRALRDFGFGIPTGIELPGEVTGTLRKPFQWSGLSRYSMSIGYEVTVTPMQVATAAAAIANQGVLMRPHLIGEVRDRDGNVIRATEPRAVRRVTGVETAQTMLRLMRGVVENGTGKAAGIVGFSVAGKTGTARLPNFQTGGYYENRYIGAFIGVAPADNPRLAILVQVVDPDPSLGYYGAMVAAPVFSRIAKRTLDQWGITPLANLNLGGETGAARNPAYDGKPGVMPDLRGATLTEVITLLGADFTRARVEGNGRVVAQEPAPGESTWSGELAVRLE